MSDRLVFLVEWYDTAASLIRKFYLIFYPDDNTLEMTNLKHDIKTPKMFLKRCECPTVSLKDLFIGSILNIYSR